MENGRKWSGESYRLWRERYGQVIVHEGFKAAP
jgi:hypothetical protein